MMQNHREQCVGQGIWMWLFLVLACGLLWLGCLSRDFSTLSEPRLAAPFIILPFLLRSVRCRIPLLYLYTRLTAETTWRARTRGSHHRSHHGSKAGNPMQKSRARRRMISHLETKAPPNPLGPQNRLFSTRLGHCWKKIQYGMPPENARWSSYWAKVFKPTI